MIYYPFSSTTPLIIAKPSYFGFLSVLSTVYSSIYIKDNGSIGASKTNSKLKS